jgi:hypothetical protein
MSLISPASLAGLAGLSTRQLQRMAHAGKVPTAKRTAGGHWEITDSKEVRKWARGIAAVKVDQRKAKTRRGWSFNRKINDAKVALRWMKAQVARPEADDFERRVLLDVAESLADELRSGWGVEIVSAPARRGGAWKGVEQAEETIRHWHKEHWQDATESERNHFRSLMRRMEEIAESVLSDGD